MSRKALFKEHVPHWMTRDEQRAAEQRHRDEGETELAAQRVRQST